MNINNKVFIITGASSGIGKALSKALALKGAIIVCTARSKNELDSVRDEIISSGGESVSIRADVTNLNQCIELKDKVLREYGQIDAIVLNAGVSMWAKFDQIENIEFFKNIMDVNFHGAVNCVYAVIDEIKKTKGKIISCSSGQALMGFPNHSGYVASKHALNGFLSTIAIENKNQLSILELVLSWIRGTNLRNNSFNESGKKRLKSNRKHSKESVALDKCINQIMRAIINDKSVAYIPQKLSLIPYLKLFFNGFLEKKITKAIKEN